MQNFTAGLMVGDIFVYINKSYILYWKVANDKLIYKATENEYKIACARKLLNKLQGGDNQNT